MKLFIREHLEYILFFLVNTGMLITVATLDFTIQGIGVTGPSLYYMGILSTVLLLLFLLYRYLKLKQNYQVIQTEWEEMSSAINPFEENDAIYQLLNKRLKNMFDVHTQQFSELEASRQQYYTFIHQWVHQMKTPISVMKLHLQNDEAFDAFSQSLYEELEKLQNGLDMVLHSARLDLFEKDVKIEQVGLTELVRSEINQYKQAFIRNNVYPEIHLDPFLVETDRKWTSFLIGQLITNSIKYSDKPRSKVLFSTTSTNQQVTLHIQDFGIGIPRQDIKRVFDPFFTGTNGRYTYESTGMGLYLCKEICTRLGHDIRIDSTENEGTIVSITFHSVTKL